MAWFPCNIGGGSTPQSKSVSYLKLQILKTRNVPTDGCFQLCEFKLYQNSNLYDWDSGVSITCNMIALNGYEASKIIDKNINTKFATLDWGSVQTNECNFIINLNETITLDAHSAYSFITPNDEISRDAVSWKLYGSTDGTNWDLLDERSNINITTDRTVETQSFPMQYVGGGEAFTEEFFSCAKMNFAGIILPFTLNADYKITAVFYETSYNNDAAVFGNTSGASYAHLTEYSNKWFTSNGTGEVNFGSWVANIEHTYIYNNGNGKNEFDGTEVTVNNGYTDSSLKYTVGCRGGVSSNQWGGYLKSFKIESLSTGDAICELKPYKIFKNGNLLVQGLYDIVNNKLYSTEKIVVSNDY